MSMQEEIVSALDSPKDLELIYRKSPAEFTKTFPKVFSQYPDSITLKIWHERLFFQSFFNSTSNKNNDILGKKDIILTVILSLTAGTLMKIPDLIKGIDESFFYIRESSFIVFISLAAYFLIQNNSSFKTTGTTLALFATSLIYINILPHDSNSQTLILSCLHMPFFLWSLLGISFVSGRYGDFTGRMNYIRYNGELLIFTIMILIGGAILIGVTAGLFKIISINIGRLYMSNIVVYGLVAAPIVSTLIIDKISGNRFKIAPILAKIFTPLFLVTTIVYLVAMIIQGESPYTSRDFLIIFNILLLIVLCLSVFSISDRGSNQEKTAGDFMNIALVTVTLIIDLVALSAILFRLSSFGFTPNRIAVLGANILVFGHLCGIALHYIRFFKGSSAFSSLEHWIAGYLPAYTAWTTIVAFGFPVMFWFK